MTTTSPQTTDGFRELRSARRACSGLFQAIALFSAFVNLLMLTGPMFMLQVYDRVLVSRSEETLLALGLLVAFLFLMMGLLDFARGRVATRIAGRFRSRLDRRVFSAVLRRAAVHDGQGTRSGGLRDLGAVHRFIGSPVMLAFLDIPWTPIFLAGITVFHPWLGMLAMSGGGFLILLTVFNQLESRNVARRAAGTALHSERLADRLGDGAEAVQGVGMQGNALERWHGARGAALAAGISAADVSGRYTTMSRSFRLFLQSSMLGLGAWLVLQDRLTPGAMIAASILLGRALAPVDVAIAQWTVVQQAVRGWRALGGLLSEVPDEPERTALPAPAARLSVEGITIVPPGRRQASVRLLDFDLRPGQALGVIGQTGAGKTSLARALTGVWRPANGRIRLDGAALEQYDPATLGRYIGHLPQRVQLFDGTIAENIARLSPTPDDDAVVEAAGRAAAHEMILRLPDGYDTPVSATGGVLSGGQVQRIGLARALYGEPVLLVLDEPNSALDADGTAALNRAIRTMREDGRSVIVMTHRPSALHECDVLLVMEDGARKAFGPRDEVLRGVVGNHRQIHRVLDGGRGEGA